MGLGALGLAAIDLLIFNAFRVVPGMLPPIVLMIIVGLPIAGFQVGHTTLLQTAVTDEFRGRVFGAFGAGLAGVASGPLGIVPVLTLQCLGYGLGGTLVLLLLTEGRAAVAAPGRAEARPDDSPA